jgi:uncharacterized protein YbjT (DUF2867 family)
MTILVTGGAGFVGSTAVRRMAGMGMPVRALVRDADKARRRLGDVAGPLEIVAGDVTAADALPPLLRDVTAVVHLAAIALEKRGQSYEAVNFQGTVNLVDAANRAGVVRFIHMSQNGADSASPYRFLRSKGRAQDYVARAAPRWTALRPSSIFGPQDEFFNAIARLVRLTPVVFPLIGGGTAEFQPVSVDDVAEAIVRALADDGTVGQALDLGGPEVLTLGEIERRILRTLGARRLLVPAPVWLLRAPVGLMERVLPGSPVSGELLDLLAVPNTVPRNALVERFGMAPAPFAGEHITYLRRHTAASALDDLLGRHTGV